MENQYTYYTPEQDENNQNAGGPDLKEPHKKNKKGTPKWVKTACLGLVFGLVASAAFQTSNIVAGKIIGTSDSAKKAKQRLPWTAPNLPRQRIARWPRI